MEQRWVWGFGNQRRGSSFGRTDHSLGRVQSRGAQGMLAVGAALPWTELSVAHGAEVPVAAEALMPGDVTGTVVTADSPAFMRTGSRCAPWAKPDPGDSRGHCLLRPGQLWAVTPCALC